LLPGGLQSIAFNINRKNEDLRFFEFGKTYHQKEGKYIERKHLSFFVTGKQQQERWNSDSRKSDFFYLKGILHSLFNRLGLVHYSEVCERDLFSDSIALYVENKRVGYLGVLKSK